MVSKTLIAALAAAQKKDAEERAKRDDREEFRKRFSLFGQIQQKRKADSAAAEAPAESTVWEDDGGDAPPERLPDNPVVGSERKPKPQPRKPSAPRKPDRKGRKK